MATDVAYQCEVLLLRYASYSSDIANQKNDNNMRLDYNGVLKCSGCILDQPGFTVPQLVSCRDAGPAVMLYRTKAKSNNYASVET